MLILRHFRLSDVVHAPVLALRVEAKFAPNKKWAVSPLISPPAGKHAATMADKFVCIVIIRLLPTNFNSRTWPNRVPTRVLDSPLPMTQDFDDDPSEHDPDPLRALSEAFSNQLLACLDACARGRKGLFFEIAPMDDTDEAWPEAERLRALALALRGVYAQHEQSNALCEEFLDLCSINAETHTGERKLARAFLERIERGEVGAQPEQRPW